MAVLIRIYFICVGHVSELNLACLLFYSWINENIFSTTANKKQKLENFAKVKMWYLQDHCNHDTLAPEASNKKRLYDQLAAKFPHDKEDGGADPRTFNALAQECCRFEGNL